MEIQPDNKTFLLTKKSEYLDVLLLPAFFTKKLKYKFILKNYYEDYSTIR